MVRRISLLFFAAVLLLATSLEAHAFKRVALVVGNSAYQNAARLPNPGRDASSIAEMFRNAGFDVVVLQQDVGNLDFKRAVRRFEEAALEADVAVVFYAGHGIEIGGVNYMIPIDAKLASDFDAPDEAIPLDRIIDAVTSAKRLHLVILDACRDNPFVAKMTRRVASRSVSAGLAKVEPATADTLIAYAAKAGSTAADGTGEHSPYTTALLHNLMLPGVDIRLAFGRVRDEVMKITGQSQEPFVYGSLGGTTVSLLDTSDAPATALSAPVDPNAEARLDYEQFEKVGTKEAWDDISDTARFRTICGSCARTTRQTGRLRRAKTRFADKTRRQSFSDRGSIDHPDYCASIQQLGSSIPPAGPKWSGHRPDAPDRIEASWVL